MLFRTFLFCLLFLTPPPHLSAQSDADRPDEALAVAVEELQLVVRALRAENETLRERNSVLFGEVSRLRRLLEEMQASRPAETVAEPEVPPPPGFEITYVNPAWHYLILRAGTEAGLAEGRQGRVLRDGTEIAAVTLTRVKDAESVGDLDPASLRPDGRYPRAGDRILFLTPNED